MLGFFTAATGLVTREQMSDAVTHSVPAGTEELNLRAFNAGWEFFATEYGSKAAATAGGAKKKSKSTTGKKSKTGSQRTASGAAG
jgi:hypothetical protein